MALLAIAVLATAAGMRGYAGFATWAATASDDVLAQLGLRFRRPSEKTFRAVLSRLDPADLNARMGSYFTAHVASSDPVDWCADRVGRQDAAWCFTRQSDSHASRVGVRPPCPIGARSTRCRREKQ
ncbi:DDE_Tnp_1-associated family protein [Mycobacterium ulcerans str. Harvey]|uniref:DDE_Tnp_1-associated family protein n=1 Tax=Mycobacterium ulcerans str. Harvey TaxID=1299332 RepID=A0ABN0QVT9_MYCUL|nr:DDE_Tnp_1-associated family protein [Mycobacterium ulcerans str. Harvey]